MSEQTKMIEAAKRGERVAGQHSLHACEKPPEVVSRCVHAWRTLFCNYDEDVVECSRCGLQRVARCTFDEDYA